MIYSGAPDESLQDSIAALRDAMLLCKIDPDNDHVALIAFPLILRDPARRAFRRSIGPHATSVEEASRALLQEFLPIEVRIVNDQQWTDMNLKSMTAETNVGKLEELVTRMEKLENNLSEACTEDRKKRKLLESINGITELFPIRFDPPSKYRELIARRREALSIMDREGQKLQSFYTNRRFVGYNPNRKKTPPVKLHYRGVEVCWVCDKSACHSSKHSKEERNRARDVNKQKYTSMMAEAIESSESSSEDEGRNPDSDENKENANDSSFYSSCMDMSTAAAYLNSEAYQASEFRGIVF
jgi:hypothetical protein